MKACLKVCGPTRFVIPARRATRCTTRAAPWRSRLPARPHEDRPFAPFPDSEVDSPGRARCQRDRHDLAALAQDGERAMAPLQPERLDVGTGGLRDPEAVQGQQGDEGVLASRAETGGDEQGPYLVAVEASGMGLVVEPGPTHMQRGRVVVLFRRAPRGSSSILPNTCCLPEELAGAPRQSYFPDLAPAA